MLRQGVAHVLDLDADPRADVTDNVECSGEDVSHTHRHLPEQRHEPLQVITQRVEHIGQSRGDTREFLHAGPHDLTEVASQRPDNIEGGLDGVLESPIISHFLHRLLEVVPELVKALAQVLESTGASSAHDQETVGERLRERSQIREQTSGVTQQLLHVPDTSLGGEAVDEPLREVRHTIGYIVQIRGDLTKDLAQGCELGSEAILEGPREDLLRLFHSRGCCLSSFLDTLPAQHSSAEGCGSSQAQRRQRPKGTTDKPGQWSNQGYDSSSQPGSGSQTKLLLAGLVELAPELLERGRSSLIRDARKLAESVSEAQGAFLESSHRTTRVVERLSEFTLQPRASPFQARYKITVPARAGTDTHRSSLHLVEGVGGCASTIREP